MPEKAKSKITKPFILFQDCSCKANAKTNKQKPERKKERKNRKTKVNEVNQHSVFLDEG